MRDVKPFLLFVSMIALGSPAAAGVKSPGPPGGDLHATPPALVHLPRHETAFMYVRRARLGTPQDGVFKSDLWLLDWSVLKLPARETSWGPSVGYDHLVRKGERRQVLYTTLYGRYDLQPDLRMGSGLRLAFGAVNYLNGESFVGRARWTEAILSLGIPVHFHWDDQWNLEGFMLFSRRSRAFFSPGTGTFEALAGAGMSFSF